MSRKGLVIIGMAVLLATTGGVAFAGNSSVPPSATASSAAETVNEYYDTNDENDSDGYVEYHDGEVADPIDDDNAENDILSSPSDPVSNDGSADQTEPENNDQSGNDDFAERNLIYEFSVQQVIDHNSGDPVAPQVAFGKYYHLCGLKLYDDGSFELNFNPSTGNLKTGTYEIEGDDMIVDFGDNRLDSYRILFGDEGDIESIIIASGKYIIYFG